VRVHFILCVSAKNVTLLVFNKDTNPNTSKVKFGTSQKKTFKIKKNNFNLVLQVQKTLY